MKNRLAGLVILVAGLAACGDDASNEAAADTGVGSDAADGAADGSGAGDAADGSTRPPETPTAPGEYAVLNGLQQEERDCAPLAAHGPYPVGVTTLRIGDVDVEVWYPAAAPGEFRDAYDMRVWLPTAEQAKIPDEQTPLFAHDAYRDVAVAAEGPFPLVLFSHGLAAWRMQSSTLAAHVASYGYVIAAPDHLERGLARVLEFLIPEADEAAPTLLAVRDGMASATATEGDRFFGAIDMERVVVSGHSAGGGATYRVIAGAAPGEFDAYISYASASFDRTQVPVLPGLVMLGNEDGVVRANQTLGTWAVTPEPAVLVNLARTGHLAFSDLCVIGRDRGGILQIAIEYGIEVNDLLVTLGSDGCDATAFAGMEQAFPAIHDATVSMLNGVFVDGDPTGWQSRYATCWADLLEQSEVSTLVPGSEGSGSEGSGSEGSGSEGSGSEGSGSEGSGSEGNGSEGSGSDGSGSEGSGLP